MGRSIQDIVTPVAYVKRHITGVTTQQTLDSVLVSDALSIEWNIVAYQESSGAIEYRTFRVIHNGLSGDATQLSKSEYGHQNFGSLINGLSVDAVLSGSGDDQVILLLGSSAVEIDFKIHRKKIG